MTGSDMAKGTRKENMTEEERFRTFFQRREEVKNRFIDEMD